MKIEYFKEAPKWANASHQDSTIDYMEEIQYQNKNISN